MLRLKDVSRSFGGVLALDRVSFELRRSEVHALVGENGAGKSTLIKLIGGVYRPDSGSIEVDGVEHAGLTPERSLALGISIVHQEFNLLPDLTVAENVFLGRQPRGRFGLVSPGKRRRAASEILERLGANLDPERLVRHLTIGEQQIVEVAKALAAEARMLVMDEPSAVLPDSDVERLFRVVEALRAEGTAVIYISHRLVEIFNVGQRVTVMKDGRVVTTRDVASTDRAELVNLMVGRPLSEQFPDRHAKPGEVLLEVRNLTVPRCIFDVNLEVRAGEIVGLAGLGGSGRTTLARALVGLADVSSGQVRFLGRRAPRGPAAAARRGLVLVPEDRKATGLVMGRNVIFNVGLPSVRRLERLGVLRTAAEAALAADAVKRFDIRPPQPELAVENLSGGNQQKVVLAKWLATDPRLIVLDEPTRGIDVAAKAEIYRLIESLSERGLGLLMISSELLELLGICDRIVVMHEGRIAGELARADATEERIMHLATGGAHLLTAGREAV